MFCIHCGADGAAKFCAVCGQVQQTEGGEATESPRDTVAPGDEPLWTESIQYEIVLSNPDARKRIADAGGHAKDGVTGDDLLAIFDAVSPIGISLGKLTQAILPIYDKLGIKTSRQSCGVFGAEPGRVLLATLCTLAVKSLSISEVHQQPHQCSMVAEIPSGLVTNRGSLLTTLKLCDQGVEVALSTTISGQWYDWGKSERMLEDVLNHIHHDLTTQRAGQPPTYRRVA